MAIDTRDKRASTVNLLLPFGRVAPVPDGTLDAGDRQQVSGLYRGIAAGEPVISIEIGDAPAARTLVVFRDDRELVVDEPARELVVAADAREFVA